MTRFVIFVMAAGLCPTMVVGQTLSFLKTLPGPNNQGSIMIVDASGVYSFGDTIRKYDLEGAPVWSREHPRGETAAWLASANAGVYAAGHIPPISPVGRIEAFVSLCDLGGNEVWHRPIRFADSGTINRSIAADETGVYVAGTANATLGTSYYLRKYDPHGSELWTKTFDDFVRGIAINPSGIYVRMARSIRKYDRNGNEVWARTIDNDSQNYDIKANATGVYMTGYSTARREYFLARYDSAGNQVWTTYGQSGWIALDANSVYVTAFTYRTPGQCASGLGDAFVVRYDPEGKVLWTRQFGSHENEFPQAIATTANGLFISGFGSGRAFLAKLDPALDVASPSEPRITNECVLNAASNVGGGVSPGEIVTIFGTAMGPSQLVAARGDRTVGTELAETRVLFGGLAAPLIYASSGQLGAVVPNSVANNSSVEIQVEYRGVLSKTVTLPVLKSHPGIFSLDTSGSGQAAVLNEDSTPNSQANAARRGSIISIFATGGGETSPAAPDGQIIGTAAQLKDTASVYLGGDPVTEESYLGLVSYAGAVPGSVAGLLQVNVRLPEKMSVGPVLPILTIGGFQNASPESVRIWIK